MAINSDINEALLNDVLAIYTQAEQEMLEKVAKRVAKGITTEGWNEQKLKNTQELNKEINKILTKTEKLSSATISKGIISAYKKGYESVGGKKEVHETILDELNIPMNLKMQILAANKLLENASFQVLRKADDAYTKVMTNATTGLLAGTDTRVQASQKMLNEFAEKGITSFVDKAGRNWDLSSYAEMCARTVSSHAALQGHIDRQIEVGEDLVKVSSIGTTCPICARWQGVVLSISGNSAKYHSVEEAKASGLFHPNCKHTLVMHIPELDGEGKIEPDPMGSTKESERYNLIQKQRSNERSIRYWKKRKALAITPEDKAKCDAKIKYWQHTNLLHCEKHQLRRQYAREGVMSGSANGPKGAVIGGYLKEYEDFFNDVVGSPAKIAYKTALKMNLQLFADKKMTFEKWLKEEIQSLDQLDIDKAQMKDANNKAVTPTSLYKKYIGDNPMQDWAEVSEYEKGTKEFKSGYAKWLKQQIEEIGVTYKIKPQYKEVHEDIPEEDTKLSATEIYKKYHDGAKPTDVFKSLGGEEGTGMKYGKWVEAQKKELIKNGITKTVPFDNATTQKTVNVISQASQTIDNAKVFDYLTMLKNEVHGQYDGYLKVKEQMEVFKQDMGNALESKKLDLAKEKHLEMVEKKALKEYGKSAFQTTLDGLKKMEIKEIDPIMKAHIKNQIAVYEKIKKANDPLAKYDKAPKWKIDHYLDSMKNKDNEFLSNEQEYFEELLSIHDESWEQYEEVKQLKEAAEEALQGTLGITEKEKTAFLKKKAEEEKAAKAKALASNKVSIGREVRVNEGQLVEQSKIYNELDRSDLERLSDQVVGHKLFANDNRRDILGRDRKDGHNHHNGHDVRLKSGLSDEEKELGEAFAIAYDDYFNKQTSNDINLAYLNGYENATPSMKKKIDAINKCIQSSELNEPIVLHRYVNEDIIEAIFKTNDVHSLRMGSLHENNTFMSASVGGHPSFGKRNYMITLECDKGTHALPTINHEELEVLLGKGKLEVVTSNKYTKSKPRKLQNYDGSFTEFVGDEVVVRYIEDDRAYKYEEVTPEKIDDMLGKTKLVSHHTQDSKDWISSLNNDEMTAQKRYTGSWYSEMNNVYRKNDRSDKTVVKYSEDLTSALRRAETTQPVVLRRGIYEKDLAHMLGFQGDFSKVKTHWDEINKGTYAAEDKGFLSTSPYTKGGFKKDVELRIYCPTGTHAVYVDSISSHKGERETLLNSGSIYKVHKLAKEGSKTIAYIELLGTD